MLSFQDFVSMFLDTLTGHVVLVVFLFALMDERFTWKHLKKIPFLFFSPAIATVIFIGQFWIMPNVQMIRYVLNSLSVLLMCVFWVMWVWRLGFWRTFSLVCMAGILQVAVVAMDRSLLQMFFSQKEVPFAVLAGGGIAISIAAAHLLKKLRFAAYFRLLLEDETNLRRTALFIFALELTMDTFLFLQGGVQSKYLIIYYLLAVALVILMAGFVVYLAQRFDASQKLQAQQDVIAQQQLYERDLEAIRQEVRAFRHDYKNLLAGLSQQAEEGELEQLCAALSELDAGFDQRLGEKIQASTQIGNVQIPQVRSLLLTKLTAMGGKGVECRLEVLYPIEVVGMDTWDFVRCLGILIDNAMEAVQGTVHPWVEIILLAQGEQVNLQVSNPWNGEIDPARFWEEGWSTKGAGRGLGLSNYLHILARYPHVCHWTSWADGVFVQALTIGGVS